MKTKRKMRVNVFWNCGWYLLPCIVIGREPGGPWIYFGWLNLSIQFDWITRAQHHPGCFPDGDDTSACHPGCKVRQKDS